MRDVAPRPSSSRTRIRSAVTFGPWATCSTGRWPGSSAASTCCRRSLRPGDRGFAPLTYDRIDARFGTWEDIGRIAAAPRRAPRPDDQPHLTPERGVRGLPAARPRVDRPPTCSSRSTRSGPTATLRLPIIARIFLRKPDAPFSTVTIGDTGREERIWTSFGTADWSEQIDLDVTSPATRTLITRWLRQFAERGVRIVRLDAVGYVIKKAGTSCFMVEPEIYEFLALGDGCRRFVRAGHPSRGPRWARHPRTVVGARLLDVRLRPARLAAPRLRDRQRHAAGRAPRDVAGPAVHEPRLPRRHSGPPGPRRDPDAGRDGRPRASASGSRAGT